MSIGSSRFLAVAALALAAAGPVYAGQSSPSPAPAAERAATFQKYCVSCHNRTARTGGLALDEASAAPVAASTATWERVLRRLQTRSMPPAGSRRPSDAEYAGLVAGLTTDLDRAAVERPNPGRPLLHRLNRAEYRNAVRDLLHLHVGDVVALLPADDSSYGFDNIADVLGVSPTLVERYLSAAGRVSALAMGDERAAPAAQIFRVRQDRSQESHADGLPLGTVGGVLVHHTAPLDAEYLVAVTLLRNHTNSTRGLNARNQIEVSVDGARAGVFEIGTDADLEAWLAKPVSASDAVDARLQLRVPLKAGPHRIGVAFVERPPVADTRPLQAFLRTSADGFEASSAPQISTVTLTGPFNPAGPGDTPSRRHILACRPGPGLSDAACARRILTTLARRAYRQPPATADVDRLMTFYGEGSAEGGFEAGVQRALQRILASPKFMFRAERQPTGVAAGTPYHITDLELASRLSFFLWSSLPDDELIDVASRGQLSTPAVLDRQVRRMLGDDKARALVENFGGQWLQVRNLANTVPDSVEFPDFDDTLREALGREMDLFLESVIREDRSVLSLLTADYTFVNERLARHYGIPHVYGSRFRRVPVTEDARKGLLGKGALLLVTSHARTTSPVLRGKWILENLLGSPPPPPPPNVPALTDDEEGHPRTMRERMETHRRNPVCAGCHRLMDPLGLALENFDAVGTWRTRDAGNAIDASGELMDGTKVSGVVTLRQALLNRPDVLVGTVTEKLLTYALGRGLDASDMPAVRAIVRDAARRDYRFSAVISGIVTSMPFRMRITS